MATSTRSKSNGKGRAISPRLANARRASAARSSSGRASNVAPVDIASVDDDGRPYHEKTVIDANRTLIDNGLQTETVVCTTRTYLDEDNSTSAQHSLMFMM